MVLLVNAMFYHSFPVALPQTAVSYLAFCVWMEIGESAPALRDLYPVVLKQTLNELFQRPALGPRGVNRLPQFLLLGVENGFFRCLALLCKQGVFFVQLCLPVALSVIFPIRDLLCRPREQVNLVESPPLTQLHDLFTEIPHELSGAAVFCTSPTVTGMIHIGLALHILNSERVDHNVSVEISGFVMPV